MLDINPNTSYGRRMDKKPWQHNYKNICAVCGKKFHPNRRKQRACSYKCGTIIRKGPTARASVDNFNMRCTVCGKPLYRKPYLLKIHTHHFCSKECFYLRQTRAYSGSGNPNFDSIGFKYERLCAKTLLNLGYHITLSKGSRGDYDVIAVSSRDVLLIQVKFTTHIECERIKSTFERMKKSVAPKFARKQVWVYLHKVGWRITEVDHESNEKFIPYPADIKSHAGTRTIMWDS